MKVEYVTHMGDDLMVANAARVSFNKHKEAFDKADAKLLGYLADHSHWTPFGHPHVCLRISAPVFVRTQLFKHKVGFVENEVSRRYVDSRPASHVPSVWRGRPPVGGSKQGSSEEIITTLNAEGQDWDIDFLVEDAWTYCLELYDLMIKSGVAPEQARMVLPQSMITEWYWTGSLAAYARVYKLRTDPHAQKETQDVATMIGDIIEPLFPVSWKALTE